MTTNQLTTQQKLTLRQQQGKRKAKAKRTADLDDAIARAMAKDNN